MSEFNELKTLVIMPSLSHVVDGIRHTAPTIDAIPIALPHNQVND
jgi:hypothetical protein